MKKIKMYKILNTIKDFDQQAKEILNHFGKVDYFELSQSEIEQKISDYDILIIGLGLNIDKQIFDKAENLKVIACPATGLDHIDIQIAESKGIKILSLKGETEFLNNITGTAELAFGLMLNLLRKIPFSFDSVRIGEWKREKFQGFNLKHKTLGIVGLGRLGKMMAKYGKAFEMNVIACDPYIDEQVFSELGVEKQNFNEVISKSDIISIHIPLSEQTENMFNAEIFEKMKNTSFLINTSRGKIVDELALLESLKNNQIAGYATDVLADELSFKQNCSNNSLVEYSKQNNNVVITPHIGGMTHESRKATDIFIANKVKQAI